MVTEDSGDGACHGTVSTVHVIVVLGGMVHVERIAPPAATTLQGQSIALLVMFGQTHVKTGGEILGCLLGDDVDDATIGIAAIECRGRTLHNLDVIDVVHRQTREIDIVHRLSCQALTIHKDEHALTAKAREVEMHHLILRKGELHAGHHLLQQVLDVGGVGLLDVGMTDDLREHGRLHEQFRRTGSRDNHLREFFSNKQGIGVKPETKLKPSP